MKPIDYTDNNENYIFHYSYSDLKSFLKRGFEHGDNGLILVKTVGDMFTYRGFGTIEHPLKKLITITLQHNEMYDGNFNPDSMTHIMEKENKRVYTSYRYTILNFDND